MREKRRAAEEVTLLAEVLFAEYKALKIEPSLPESHVEKLRAQGADLLKEFYRWVHSHPRTPAGARSALCLSGGGIRSATFGLGIVQGLAKRRMLGRFDFLSTVSGGGYLGSWLTAWIHRAGLEQVENELSRRPESPLPPEPEPIRHLRSYSRYMSPKPGILSADTWTLVGIFLRNLLLNWLVLLPLIAAVLLFPRLSTATLLWVTDLPPGVQERIRTWVLRAAIALGSWAIGYIVANRPSLSDADPPRSRLPRRWRCQSHFLVLCLLPLWLFALATTAFWAWTPLFFSVLGFELGVTQAWIGVVAFGATLGLGGFLVSRIWVREAAPFEALLTTGIGALGGLFIWLAADGLFPQLDLHSLPETEIYICIGAPLLLTMFFLAATIFVGLSSYFTSDADREWLARCGSWILILIVARSLVSAIVIFGPVALLHNGPAWLSSLGGLSGIATLLLGGGAKTVKKAGEGEKESWAALAAKGGLALAAPLFALFLLVVLSLGTSRLLGLWPEGLGQVDWHWSKTLGPPLKNQGFYLLNYVHYAPWWLLLLMLGCFLLVGVGMGFFININRFSLHSAYRDRLIRAYLGASRPPGERKPNPFTGFDEGDNLEMQELRGNRPMPVINLTLNVVAGKDLAWQDRKAETFTVSPLHAGSWCRGYRSAARYAYSRTFNRGITLGTATAISGAAASPNMGYHSSPAVTFLLALFNVRLGWWLGNPGPEGQCTFDTPGPRFAPGPLFAEAFSLTDDKSPYVYLSDGGHFENLGLYEMVLRRCRYILVSDAGADPGFSFEDLGNAISKIRVDLGVPIRFEKISMRRRAAAASFDLAEPPSPQFPYFAVGRIGYSCVDYLDTPGDLGPEADGQLIYIKACLNGTEPVDVFHYAKSHPAFPHEWTANQHYTEAQFESYRELGANALASLCANLPAGATLAELFDAQEMPLSF